MGRKAVAWKKDRVHVWLMGPPGASLGVISVGENNPDFWQLGHRLRLRADTRPTVSFPGELFHEDSAGLSPLVNQSTPWECRHLGEEPRRGHAGR